MEKAKDVYSSVLKSASKFLSPSFRDFFARKATNDYNTLVKASNSDKSSVDKYIKEQRELNESLDRSSLIYNMYRDNRSFL